MVDFDLKDCDPRAESEDTEFISNVFLVLGCLIAGDRITVGGFTTSVRAYSMELDEDGDHTVYVHTDLGSSMYSLTVPHLMRIVQDMTLDQLQALHTSRSSVALASSAKTYSPVSVTMRWLDKDWRVAGHLWSNARIVLYDDEGNVADVDPEEIDEMIPVV